jgi:hypothetical protein
MKTLSYKQPWAYLVAVGLKDIENRTWKLPEKYKGKRILIHASGLKGTKFKINLTDDQMKAAFGSISEQAINGKFDFGAIIGSVEIVDCVINHPSIWAEKTDLYDRNKAGLGPIYNWVLANPILFPEPIPAKGKLSFWDYPNILAEPEEKDGPLFCHCQLPVDEKNQIIGNSDDFKCRYCGGRWYK